MKQLSKSDKSYTCPERSRRKSEIFSSLIFYLSILFFLIGFNFTDNPAGGWYQQWMPNLGGRQISDIIFLDSLTGYAVTNNLSPGDTGYILKTTNRGDNWNFVFTVNRGFTAIEFVNLDTGYACGGSGGGTTYLCRTTNAGLNWSLVSSPSAAKWKGMSVLSYDALWLVDDDGLTGGVFRTTDSGVSWQQQLNLGSLNPDHIYMFNGRIGFISRVNTGAPYVRKTTNGGLNWDTIVNNGGFVDMYFVDSLTGWRAYGTMRKTTDGGLNWITQILPSGGMIITSGVNKFSNVNRDTIWAVGGTIISGSNGLGMIYRTLNGGATWLFQTADTSIHIFQYFYNEFINNSIGWAYSPLTGVHTTTGGDPIFYTSIKQVSGKIPKDFKLFNNYPNPFNSSSKIKYEISKTSNVSLEVFDITGRLVNTLVNEKLQAGEYETIFDAVNLSSGVYFYSLIIDGIIVETKRMLLLK